MGNRKELWKTADRFLLIISLLSRSFFLCSWMFSFFVLLAFFLTPSFAIPSFLYPSLSPPIFPCLPFPVLYFIPRPSFPLTFLHSHLCSYPPQCINSFLSLPLPPLISSVSPFVFLLPSPLSLPSSSSSQSSPLELSALRLSPGLVVSVAAAAGGVRPLHSVQLSSLAEGPQPRWAAQERLRLLRYGSPVTRHTCGWWSWYLNPFPSILFHLFLSRPQRQCLCSAVQPGVRLLPSHVFLQQQHRGLSREGPHCHPRPPARGHDWDVSIIWKFLFQLRQKQSKWRIYCIILESTITATLYLLSVIFNNSPEYSDSQYCNLLTLYLSEGKGVFLLFKARIWRWRLLNDYLSLVDLTWLICIQVRWY